MEGVEREQVLAFRLASHNLTRRLDQRAAVEAAPCGIQETPLGSAAVAFAARVEGLTPAALEHALAEERALVTLWSVRGAPYVVPAADLDVFSVGALPLDARSFRQSLGGWADALADAGLDPFETLELMVHAARELLDGRTLHVNDLRDRIYEQVPSLATTTRPAGAHADMPEPLFRAVPVAGGEHPAEPGCDEDALADAGVRVAKDREEEGDDDAVRPCLGVRSNDPVRAGGPVGTGPCGKRWSQRLGVRSTRTSTSRASCARSLSCCCQSLLKHACELGGLAGITRVTSGQLGQVLTESPSQRSAYLKA